MRYISSFLLLSILACADDSSPAKEEDQEEAETVVFVGTYTQKEAHVNGQGEGIYSLQYKKDSGELVEPILLAEITNPSYLTLIQDKQLLLAVSEISAEEENAGSVTAYGISDKHLKKLSTQPTYGNAPCYVTTDPDHRYAVVANYSGGVVAVYPIDGQEGLLSATDTINLQRRLDKPSHPHAAVFSPDGDHLYIPDKGHDRIYSFEIDYTKGALKGTDQKYAQLPDGAGPRHFVWHPNGRVAYVINELNNTVTAFEYIKHNGKLGFIQQISTLPSNFQGKSYAADIRVHPSGRFLYGSNRGDDSIVLFSVEDGSGKLSLTGHFSVDGSSPRNFAISPDGKFLFAANQNSSNISSFSIDQSSGRLQLMSSDIQLPTPVCLMFYDR